MNISEGAVDRKNVLGGVLRSVRYTIAIAWRELMLGRYKLIICALCAFLGLYATDGLQRKIEGLDVSYYVLFLLGLGMGIAALDYLFHDRYSMLYRALPLGKRWMLILRMSVSLLSCAAVILAVYLLFFYAKGLEDPEFHLTDFYKIRLGVCDVLDPLIGLFGTRLWLTVGWELFKSGMIVFSCGFFLGTFSAVLSPSKIFAPISALVMLGVEVLIGVAHEIQGNLEFVINGVNYNTDDSLGIGQVISPAGAIINMLGGVIWMVDGLLIFRTALLFAATVVAGGYTRSERAGRGFSNQRFFVLGMIYLALSLICIIVLRNPTVASALVSALEWIGELLY